MQATTGCKINVSQASGADIEREIGIEAVESLTARGKRALAAALKGRKAELGYDDD